MIEKIKNALSTGPKTVWFVSIPDPGFISNASVEPLEYEKKYDYSHFLTMEFVEPIRDGNDVSHLNIREDTGEVNGRIDLEAGTMTCEMLLNPTSRDLEFVSVTTDDRVHDTVTLEFGKSHE